MELEPEEEICYCVLLTGVTGFLGKVVLEELFRRREEFKPVKVVIIARGKCDRSPETRFREDIVSSPCFSNLPVKWVDSVQVVEGDLSHPKCGIGNEIYERLTMAVTHIIHCAGSVDFELPVIEAAEANITSALNVVELARRCLKL